MKKLVKALIGSALVAAAPLPALSAIEEIVVTARQRAESLQDTPTTVSALLLSKKVMIEARRYFAKLDQA